MEIRRLLWGENTGVTSARPARSAEPGTAGTGRPSADRVELSRDWARAMEEQRAQAEAALLGGGKQEKRSNGILDMLDGADSEREELDALSAQMKVQQKCLKIAMRIMQGKKVPPEDEQYLMENDPEGYKLAIAAKALVKEDKEECESVLDEEDKQSGGTAQASEAAPAEGSSGGEAAESEAE